MDTNNIIQYEEFEKIVRVTFHMFLSEQNKRVLKFDEQVKGVVIGKCELPIRNIYDIYVQKGNHELKGARDAIKMAAETLQLQNKEMGFEHASKNLHIYLLNAEKSKDFIKKIPHRMLCDLAVVYGYESKTDDGIDIGLISYEGMDELSLSENELYLAAVNHSATEKIGVTATHRDVGVILGVSDESEKDNDEDCSYRIITTKQYFHGAAAVTFPNLLKETAEEFEDDLFVVPATIHAMYVFPTSGNWTPEQLKELVGHLISELDEAEKLSDRVYFYDKDSGMMYIVA